MCLWWSFSTALKLILDKVYTLCLAINIGHVIVMQGCILGYITWFDFGVVLSWIFWDTGQACTREKVGRNSTFLPYQINASNGMKRQTTTHMRIAFSILNKHITIMNYPIINYKGHSLIMAWCHGVLHMSVSTYTVMISSSAHTISLSSETCFLEWYKRCLLT